MTNIKAFTLVELIVVVTILAILSTIGFVSYSSYLIWVRDTNRISNMKAISDWLELYRTRFSLPLPEYKVEVKANWAVIAYQWYAWANVLESIEFSNGWKDPKFDTYFSYYLTKDKKYFQLMWFLEEEEELQLSYVWINLNIIGYDRYPIVYGNNLGILTDEFNTPIQELSDIISVWEIDLWWINSWTVYNMHMKDWLIYSFSWTILNHKIYSYWKPSVYWPIKGCPDWFVWVHWNSSFNQEWFCLSAFEMSYDENDPIVLDWTGWLSSTKTDWNIYDYEYWKKIVARKWWFPIAYIKQSEAIDACKSMWKWFHLQTENEWMTMARDVELVWDNWTWGELLNWYISNWNSNDDVYNHWCSIDLSDPNDSEYTGRRWGANVWFKPNDTCNETRKYKLSNWVYLWDIWWNLREHVNKANTIDGSWFDSWTIAFWIKTWTINWNDSDLDLWKPMHWPLFALNASAHWIWTVDTPAWVSGNIIIRWWCAECKNDDWLYWIELDRDKDYIRYKLGFRCAYIKQ